MKELGGLLGIVGLIMILGVLMHGLYLIFAASLICGIGVLGILLLIVGSVLGSIEREDESDVCVEGEEEKTG